MKRNLMILLSVLFVLSFSAMQVFAAKKFSKDHVVEKQEKQVKEEEVKMSDKKILVAYYSATGMTKEVAEKIAKAVNGLTAEGFLQTRARRSCHPGFQKCLSAL